MLELTTFIVCMLRFAKNVKFRKGNFSLKVKTLGECHKILKKKSLLTFQQNRQNKWKFLCPFQTTLDLTYLTYCFQCFSNFRQFWGSKPGLIKRIQVLRKEKKKQAAHCQSRLQTSRKVLTKSATTVLCLSKNHKNSINLLRYLSLQDWQSRIKQDWQSRIKHD